MSRLVTTYGYSRTSIIYRFIKRNLRKTSQIERSIYSALNSILLMKEAAELDEIDNLGVGKMIETSSASSASSGNSEYRAKLARKFEKSLTESIEFLWRKITIEERMSSERFHKMCKIMSDSDFFYFLIMNFDLINFEEKKRISKMFDSIMARREQVIHPLAKYILSRTHFFTILVSGCTGNTKPTFADKPYFFGQILRACLKHREILQNFLKSEQYVFSLMALMEDKAFDIATDAFLTVRDALTRNRNLASEFVLRHFQRMTYTLNKFLDSDNIALRSQGLILLNELLLGQDINAFSMAYFRNKGNVHRIIQIFINCKLRSCELDIFLCFKMMIKNLELSQVLDGPFVLEEKEAILEKLSTYFDRKYGTLEIGEKAIQLTELLSRETWG